MSKTRNNDDIIEFSPQIVGILNRIHESHSLLTVQVNARNEHYSSALIEINADKNSLLLDELYPIDGHQNISPGTSLQVQGRVNGIDTRFTCQVNKVETGSGVACYYCSIPDKLHYHQRRKQFRVSLDQQTMTFIELQAAGKTAISAQVFDISHNGLGLYVAPGAASLLKNHQKIKDVKIEFPGCPSFHTTLEIRSMRMNKAGNTVIVGTQFRSMPTSQQRLVQRYVALLERHTRRNRLVKN